MSKSSSMTFDPRVQKHISAVAEAYRTKAAKEKERKAFLAPRKKSGEDRHRFTALFVTPIKKS